MNHRNINLISFFNQGIIYFIINKLKNNVSNINTSDIYNSKSLKRIVYKFAFITENL